MGSHAYNLCNHRVTPRVMPKNGRYSHTLLLHRHPHFRPTTSTTPETSAMYSPLLREAALWFGVGGAVAAFVCGAVLALAALVGAGSTARITRAVGTSVDKLVGCEPPVKHVVASHAITARNC